MTQSAQSHRQMRSIPRCPKAVFMFLFLVPFTIWQQCTIYPQEFSTELILLIPMGGLFDEMGVLHVVEAGVEEADLGDYWQGEE